MNKLPKFKDFNPPTEYFDQLPDQIMEGINPKKNLTWLRYAASIAVLLVAGIWLVYQPAEEMPILTLEQEVNLYIDSQYWTAEDVLSMADNPEEILDQIINEEYPEGMELWEEDDQTWF